MPRAQENLDSLRDTLGKILGNQKDYVTDARIPELLNDLGLDDRTEYSSSVSTSEKR